MIIELPDGTEVEAPDDMPQDKAIAFAMKAMRPVQQLSNPRAQAESVLATMSPAEQTLAAVGGGMYRTGRNAGNLLGNVAEKLTGNRLGMPTDDELRADEEIDAPLAENNRIATFAGELAPQIPLMMVGGGGATVAKAGLGARLANVARGAATGAGQGYVFSGPDSRESNALLGGGLGGTVAAVANPLAALARNAGKRASKIAVDLFEPSEDRLREIVAKWGRPGETVEAAIRRAGDEIRKARIPSTGGRLIDPVGEAGEYTLRANEIMRQGGEGISRAMREADRLGLKGRPREVYQQLLQAKKDLVGSAPFNRLTGTQREAVNEIDTQLAYFQEIFGTKAKPGAVNPGAVPEITRPLELPTARDAAGRATATSPVTGESMVGASAPDTLRVFDPPYITGRVNKIDPVTKKFVKGGQVPAQPGSIPSREVEVATDEWEPWRSFVQRRAGRDRLIPGTMRPRPLGRGEYWPREVVQEGVPGVGSPMQMIDFEDLPLSTFEESAKRPFSQEGFLKKGSAKFRDPKTAEADPGTRFFQRGTGILKEHTENALPDNLRREFIQAKRQSQLGKVFGDTSDDSAIKQAVPQTSRQMRGSPFGLLWNKIATSIARKSRPYSIKTNEGIEALADLLPHNTDAAIRAAVIEALRQKESR